MRGPESDYDMDEIRCELKRETHDKAVKFARDSLHVLQDVAPVSVVIKTMTDTIHGLAAANKVTSTDIADMIMTIAGDFSKLPDVDTLYLRAFAERFVNEHVNVTCGPWCTQPGNDFRTNTKCHGFINFYTEICPCTPVVNSSSMVNTPLFKGGVFLKQGYEIDKQRTIVEYMGEKMEDVDFAKLRANDPRRKHAIVVGNENRRIVPLTHLGKPEVHNLACRVRDCGKKGNANCQLWEDGKERLWLVALDEKIYGGAELLLQFHDDGISDDESERRDATFEP